MSSAVSADWSLRRIAIARRSSRRPSAAARTSSRAGLPKGTIQATGLSCRVTTTSSPRAEPKRLTGGRAQPCARRVRRTPGARAGGIERRLARTTAFKHPEALDHGPHRVAVPLRGQRQRLGGARAAVPAGPSEAGHQVERAAVVEPFHQFPDCGGATNGRVGRSLVPQGIYPGLASSRRDMTRTGGRAPGSAGVPPASTMVGLRRVVHFRPPAGTGGTPALPGAPRARFRSIAEMPAPPRF